MMQDAQNHPASPSITERLPVEIMSNVFEFYIAQFPPKQFPFTLGAVCRRWRQIAWSTPQIWIKLRINIYETEMLETRIQLAEDWISRSGKLPLSISFSFYVTKKHRHLLHHVHRLIDIINRHCDHWYSLYLWMPSSLLARFNDSSCVSSTLRTLTVAPIDSADFILPLSTVAPQTLDSGDIFWNPLKFNWTQVTNISACRVPVDRALQILQLASNLQKCVFGMVILPSAESQVDAYTHVTHPQLEILDVGIACDESEALFFDNVTVPGLKELVLHGCDDVELRADQLIPFVTRSSTSCALESFTIEETDYSGEDLVRIIRVMPSLEELSLWHHKGDLDTFYHTLISHFPTIDSPASAPIEPLLASLQIFQWHGNGAFPWTFIPNFFASLSQDEGTNTGNGYPPRPMKVIRICCGRGKDDPIPYIPQNIISLLANFVDRVNFDMEVQVEEHWADLMEMSVDNQIRRLVTQNEINAVLY